MSEPIFSAVYEGEGLLSWRVAHALETQVTGGELILADTPEHSFHLLRLTDEAFLYRLVRIRALIRPLPGARADFYVHHFGYIDIAQVALTGQIVTRGPTLALSAQTTPSGLLEIDLEFLNLHPTLSIGTALGGTALPGAPVYAGDGAPQFALRRIDVETRDATPHLSAVPPPERITLIDVGAQQGLQLPWMLRAPQITPIVFEPIPAEAQALRRTLGRIPGAAVIETALAHASGPRTLHITDASECSSLLPPNAAFLSRYALARYFEVVDQIEVPCARYDALFASGLVPAPDVIKIDVQGFEYEVLLGFGALLETCLAIELEAQLYPLYVGQKLLGDLVALLDTFGFVLRRLDPVDHFEGDAVEFNAFFTRRRQLIAALSQTQQRKLALVAEAWALPPYA